MTTDADLEELTAYHPYDLPPRQLHLGPSGSDLDATGMPYFRVGKGAVTRITRRRNGDVYIYRKGLPTLVHAARGWASVADDT